MRTEALSVGGFSILLLASLIVPLFSGTFLPFGYSTHYQNNVATIQLNPQALVRVGDVVGTLFEQPVEILNAQDVFGWQVTVTYDPTVLNVQLIVPGPYFDQAIEVDGNAGCNSTAGDTCLYSFIKFIDNTAGRAVGAFSLLNNLGADPQPLTCDMSDTIDPPGTVADACPTTLVIIEWKVLKTSAFSNIHILTAEEDRTAGSGIASATGHTLADLLYNTEDSFYTNRADITPPNAEYTVTSRLGYPAAHVDSIVSFDASASTGAVSYGWKFGDKGDTALRVNKPVSQALSPNPMEFSRTGTVTADVIFAGLGTASDFSALGSSVAGKIALIQRGQILFKDKVANAAAAGAVGAIVYNNQYGNFLGTLLEPSEIPAVSLSDMEGQFLKTYTGGKVSVTLRVGVRHATATIMHAYSTEGNYRSVLEVEGSSPGTLSRATKTIIVGPGPRTEANVFFTASSALREIALNNRPGTTFNVDVLTDNIPDLFAWRLSINYDTEQLTAIAFELAPTPWVDAVNAGRASQSGPIMDDLAGNILYSYTFLDSQLGFSTSGVALLGTIVFRLDAPLYGTVIHLETYEDDPVSGTVLMDTQLVPIAYPPSDAILDVGARPPFGPTLGVNNNFHAVARISGVTAGGNFTISIDVGAISAFDAYDIRVGFDPAVLNITVVCFDASLFSESGLSIGETIAIEDSPGVLRIAQSLLDGNVSGTGLLARITFVALDTPLDSFIDVGLDDDLDPADDQNVILARSKNLSISHVTFDAQVNPSGELAAGGNQGPLTAITDGPYSGSEGSPIAFNGARSTDLFGQIVDLEWNFGDGTKGTGVRPVHIYNDNGAFIVELTITNNNWFTDSTFTTVTVSNVPPLVSIGPDRLAFSGDLVEFTGTFVDPGTADTHTIVWDFGDGSSITGVLNSEHQYLLPGVYRVTLTVTDDDGGVGSASLTVTVRPIPVSIDIKPGSPMNFVSLRSQGSIGVALLATPSFDVTNVEISTVRFGRTGTEAEPVHSALADVDGDGDLDLLLLFKTQNTGIKPGDVHGVLSGRTLDGKVFSGSDVIRVFLLGSAS